jgi:hypothetical protein
MCLIFSMALEGIPGFEHVTGNLAPITFDAYASASATVVV